MVRALKSLREYRGWRTVFAAGALCIALALAAATIVDVTLMPLSTLSTVLVALIGGLIGICLAGAWSATLLVQKLGAQNMRRDVALNNMTQGLCMFDRQGRLMLWNRQYEAMYRISPDQIWRGCTIGHLLELRKATGTLPQDPAEYQTRLRAELARGNIFTLNVEMEDGRLIAVINRPTQEGGWLATHEDITEYQRAVAELENTRGFLDMIIESVPSPIVVKSADDLRYLLINHAAETYFGMDRAAIIGKTSADILPTALVDAIREEDTRTIESGKVRFHVEHAIMTPGHGMRIVTTTRLPVKAANGKLKYLISVLHDITDIKRSEQRIEHMAHHDTLTDLPNRTAFNTCIDAMIETAALQGDSFAVLSIDLDRFKTVNDVFGHPAGDALLREVARRLEAACQGAFLARIGGDEFIVITPAGPQPDSAEALAERLNTAFENDISVGNHSTRVGLTIGIGIYPQDGANTATLVANADAALSRAKSEARGSIRFFDMSMDTKLRDKRALQQDLRKAVENNELELHYQPQAVIDGTITGFEALARWHHPQRGLVPPCDFIPLAEECGIIGALGEWVLRTACREAASWPRPLHIAVNLSPVQFQHGDLPNLVHQILLETGLSPSRLELEITEGVLIGDFARAVSILRRLKNLGVRIAMDDFGTGYSSLSYLQSFPFDGIKIDRAFVADIANNQQSAAIVRAVIALSRGLGVPVVAEGVETEEQRQFLADEKCDGIQGYLIGRPKPIAEYAGMVGRKPGEKVESEASAKPDAKRKPELKRKRVALAANG